jgi:periplasmic protein TonB
LSPIDGSIGGGAGDSASENQSASRTSGGFSAVPESRMAAATAGNGLAGSNGNSLGSRETGGAGGSNGNGQGTGAGPGSGTGPGPSRGPRVVSGDRPEYPDNARSKGWEGTVKLQILVSTEGRVEDMRIASSSGYAELDQAALRAVRSWRFSPALQKGAPVAAWATLPVVFAIN